jgi:hypothetical protein
MFPYKNFDSTSLQHFFQLFTLKQTFRNEDAILLIIGIGRERTVVNEATLGFREKTYIYIYTYYGKFEYTSDDSFRVVKDSLCLRFL